jgi:hypothetical protein
LRLQRKSLIDGLFASGTIMIELTGYNCMLIHTLLHYSSQHPVIVNRYGDHLIRTYPLVARLAINEGYRVLDVATIKSENLLPGFSPTGGVLPVHNSQIPPESFSTFAGQVQWSAQFINVLDHLPEAAFVYALIEFFVLRPGIDLYKEDIELQSEGGSSGVLTAEVVAVTGVRLLVFFVVAILTNFVFG